MVVFVVFLLQNMSYVNNSIMIYLKKSIISIFWFLFTLVVFSQELPPINVFTPNDYNAENQNWSISQNNDKYIYVANNKGLLEYDGVTWRLFETPNETIMRSVKVYKDKIYTGCYMEFGFWDKLDTGELKYTSLSSSGKINFIEDEQIWNIIAINKWVLFQSLDNIYIYDLETEVFKTIKAQSNITKSFLLEDESVFYQDVNFGLFQIKNGDSKLITSLNIINNAEIIDVFKQGQEYVLLTQNKGFFKFNPSTKKITPWNVNANEIVQKYTVYSSLKLKNEDYAIGTISNGILVLNRNGSLKYQINQNKGLNNNTVLKVFEDSDNNIWAGLDNGISCINHKSPIRIYNDEKGNLGTVYTSVIYKGYLYLGSNQGLFYKPLNTEKPFQFIEGTQGQVWDLKIINDVLFCGHNMGTYIIKGDSAEQISNIQGAWSIKEIPSNPNLLMQGNYDGLHILEKNENKWEYRNKIEGFNISSRFFELMDHRVFVNHEYQGIFKVDVDSEFKKVKTKVCDSVLKGLNSGLIKYNGSLLYAYKKGIYKYDKKSDQFVKDTILSKMYTPDTYISGKLINDLKAEKLWGFTNTEFINVSPGKLSKKPIIESVKLSNQLSKGVSSYENLLNIDNENYLFGTSSGYIIVNVNNAESNEHKVILSKIGSGEFNEHKNMEKLNLDGVFESNINSFEFNFSVPNYKKNTTVFFQYKLEGIFEEWSPWQVSSKIKYDNLPYGNYTFKVRSKINNEISKNEASYAFEIKTPWYLTKIAIVLYVLFFVFVVYLLNRFFHNYYEKQKEKTLNNIKNELSLKELENKQQLMGFENEKLLQDIDNKNRELAISTMSLIKKNEFLNNIKKELSSKDVNSNIKDVINIIDKNINNNDDWQFFEQAFNNADKDFLQKIKSKHSSLTPNDLKLCAYLRLNLSSKEIAPLLNISARSVEVKRYRLRKKMDLKHEISLTSYILDI